MVSLGAAEVPLTYPQQLLWMLDFVHPGQGFAPGFIIRSRYRLRGPLDIDALTESLRRVIDEHDALRTTIDASATPPFQRVHPTTAPHVAVIDVADAGDHGIEAFFTAHETAPRDVSVAPVLWVQLGRVAADDHLFSLVVHHPVCDNWSLEVILDDLVRHYRALTQGEVQEWDPPTPASAFAFEQQARLDAHLDSHLAFWAEAMEDVPVVPMPLDAPRTPETGEKKGVWRFEIDPALHAELQAVARASRATMFMVLLAAYTARLARVTGTRDITVPTLSAGRQRLETHRVVTYMNNAIPLRTRLPEDPTLAEVVKAVRSTCLEAFAHEVPLVLLLDHVPDAALLLSDERYVTAPFQLVASVEPKVRDMGACRCEPSPQQQESEIMTIPVDMLTTVQPDGDGLVGEICYSVGLFEESTLQALSDDLVAILWRLVKDRESRLSELDVAG